MRKAGEPVGSLFPLSFPGMKTRFEELLVDEDGGRLLARMRDFFEATDLPAFAARHAIPDKGDLSGFGRLLRPHAISL
ncbi:MAG: hypothetical protein HGA45_39420 [Chloroflexales bacterium]|nr:hypothetical protein [Chloroflexales bacterium]